MTDFEPVFSQIKTRTFHLVRRGRRITSKNPEVKFVLHQKHRGVNVRSARFFTHDGFMWDGIASADIPMAYDCILSGAWQSEEPGPIGGESRREGVPG